MYEDEETPDINNLVKDATVWSAKAINLSASGKAEEREAASIYAQSAAARATAALAMAINEQNKRGR